MKISSSRLLNYWMQLTSPLDSAQSALKEKHWEKAVSLYARLRHYVPKDWRGYGEACVAYRHLGQWDQADCVIEEELVKLGEVKQLLIAYGDTAMDQQRWDEALTRWERLIKFDATYKPAYERSVVAANRLAKFENSNIAFKNLIDNFGYEEIDPITYRHFEFSSKRMPKNRMICFVGGFLGYTGHLRILHDHMTKDRSGSFEVYWLSDVYEEFVDLINRGCNAFYMDSSPMTMDLLLRTDIAIYATHDVLPLSNGIRQSCLAGAIKIQLWHGIPTKWVGYKSVFNWDNVNSASRFISDVCSFDYVIAESEMLSDVYSSAFPSATIVPIGSCRCDTLLDRSLANNIEQDKRIILYAPTYRERSQDTKLFLVALQELVDLLENNENFVLVVKPHLAFVTETRLDLKEFAQGKKNTIFVDGREDIYPWVARADYLVTDYSSVYYDFLITKKPIVFFRPDVDLYDARRIRVQYPFETGLEPGPVITKATEFVSALLESESEKWQLNRAALAEKFHAFPHDGMVTKRVADFVVSLLRV